ncbi:MAG: hypothetical protein ACERLG_01905 [Sedimentibacter sp.]
MLQFKSKGLLRVHYTDRKPIISYLYENGTLYFATSRTSRKMKYFTTVSQDIELSLGIFSNEKVPAHIEIMPDNEEFFDYLKKAASLPPFINFKKHQAVRITLL